MLSTVYERCVIDQDDVFLCSVSSNHHNESGLKIEEKVDDGEWTTFLHKNVNNIPNIPKIGFFNCCANHVMKKKNS